MSEEKNKTANETLEKLINQTRTLIGANLFDAVVQELDKGSNEQNQSRQSEMMAVVFFTYGNLIRDFNRVLVEHERLVVTLTKLPCVQEGLHRASFGEDTVEDAPPCRRGRPN